MNRRWLAVVALLGVLAPAGFAGAQPEPWTSRWIAAKGSSRHDYGVYHFRRGFDLTQKPRSFRVHVTADNRYELYVNGRRVVRGSARGDREHWRYETVDLAPFLRSGKNVLAAVVWNFAEHAPQAQITARTGFLLQGDTDAEQKLVDTGPMWKAVRDAAYEPIPFNSDNMKFYYVVGPGDRVHGDAYPWNWETPGFDDGGWEAAQPIGEPTSRIGQSSNHEWLLIPRDIPLMEEKTERLVKLRRAAGIVPPKTFPSASGSFRVPARTHAELLLDQTYLTTAYPELVVSGGKGSTVALAYAEGLWDPNGGPKGNRNDIEGKVFRGNRDEFLPDGGKQRLYSPLWWRTYRYLQMTIDTKDEPLVIEDLRGIFTAYPFARRARLSVAFDATRQRELDQILDVGWRTARLCAHETYMDCPYYEQLQYVGDTRVQVLVSLYMSGDGRLARKAIEDFNDSRIGNNVPYSRHPSAESQLIPTFSLLWIGMVRDYWWYRDDPDFVQRMLTGVRATLKYFDDFKSPDGTLTRLPGWVFVDYTARWRTGIPPGWNRRKHQSPDPISDPRSSSSVVDLHYLLALGWAADLERALGETSLAERYMAEAARLRDTIRRRYWDDTRKLIADTGFHKEYSQHANIFAVLGDVIEGDEAKAVIERILGDESVVPATMYFRYYLHLAMRKVGMADRYLEQLGPWRRMLASGLTTWAETDDQLRSDSHAWGASPNIEFFRIVLGIDSAAAGWKKVRIAPALGDLKQASGSIPHPNGDLGVAFKTQGDRLNADITLPKGIDGELVWKGQSRPLAAGKNHVTIEGR